MDNHKEYWKSSVHSDGTALFVRPNAVKIGDLIEIRIRMLADAPVDAVYLRYIADGSHELAKMQIHETLNGLVYYHCFVKMTQCRMVYQFYIKSQGHLYYYTQKGLFSYLQDETCSFVLMADYVQPEWVKNAVFYQIFPERFANGDDSLTVKDGEITVDGHSSMRIRDWRERPTEYEVSHCLDFYGGDLIGIKEKIPYLKELGVTALYLNPIFEAPSVHKYDCTDYEKVDKHFGGDPAFAALMKELHDQDMKLVLDISVNHTGTAHKWFNKDATYYPKEMGAYHNPEAKEREYYLFTQEGYVGWRGNLGLPELNYRSEELRQKIYKGKDALLRKWLREPYQIDGWRFDVADVMAKYGPDQLDHEIWQGISAAIKEENPQAYILAEDWCDCAEHLNGKEWDSAMNYYTCARVLRCFMGLDDPYLAMNPDLRGMQYKISAEEAKDRILSYLGKLPFAFWQNQFNLLNSHDVGRIQHAKGVNPREYRGAVISQFTMIGAPSVYYGDEAEIDGWYGSMEGCRFTMPWDERIEEKENYKLHKALAALKKEHKAFSEGSFQFLYAKDQILSYARFDEKETFLTIMSTEEMDRVIRIPVGILGIVHGANAYKTDLLGNDLEASLENGQLRILVKAHEAYLLQL